MLHVKSIIILKHILSLVYLSICLGQGLFMSYPRTIIQKRIAFVMCAIQLADSLLLKKLNYFEIMLNIFEFFLVQENVEF